MPLLPLLLGLVAASNVGCSGEGEQGRSAAPTANPSPPGLPPSPPPPVPPPALPNYPAAPPGTPPSVPSGPATSLTTPQAYAIDNLFFGDTANGDTSFTPDPNGWNTIGYNLDGISTTSAAATNVCRPIAGSPVVLNGANGIDNSFGENVVPLLAAGNGFTSALISQKSIQAGLGTTLLLDVTGIDPGSANSQTASALSLGLLHGAAPVNYGGTLPTFSPGDEWRVDSSSILFGLQAHAPFTATTVFPAAGITGGAFTTGAPETFVLPVPILGAAVLPLTFHHGIITFQLEPDGSAGMGILAGVLNISEVKAAMTAVAASLESSALCQGLPGLLQALDQATDIMTDGTNEGGEICDGISVGVGFTARPVGEPRSVVSVTPARAGTPCP